MVFFWPKLRYVDDVWAALFLASVRDVDCVFEFFDGNRREDDVDVVCSRFVVAVAVGTPEGLDVGLGPGGIRHNDVYGAADFAVHPREQLPVLTFQYSARAGACAGIYTLSALVERFEHVG